MIYSDNLDLNAVGNEFCAECQDLLISNLNIFALILSCNIQMTHVERETGADMKVSMATMTYVTLTNVKMHCYTYDRASLLRHVSSRTCSPVMCPPETKAIH